MPQDRGRRLHLSDYDWKVAAVVGLVSAATFATLAVLGRVVGDEEMGLALRDPLAVARAGDDVNAIYVGWLSYAGVLLWGAAAAAGMLGGRLAAPIRSKRPVALVLGTGGLLSLGLLLDDLYQLHESVVPRLLGVHEKYTMLGWALIVTAWLVLSARVLVRARDLPLLLVGGALLAASIGVDVLESSPPVELLTAVLGGAAVVEDGTKLVALLAWATFFWRTAVAESTFAVPVQTRGFTDPSSRSGHEPSFGDTEVTGNGQSIARAGSS